MTPQWTAFFGVAAIVVWFLAAAGAPTPLYVVYQHEWHFSAAWLTFAFAVYAGAVLASLLVGGGLSDRVGRRAVLAGAVVLESVALALFLFAGSVVWLAAARCVQGIATGAALPALSATPVDLEPPGARIRAGLLSEIAALLGLALGALGSGALIEFAPAPTRLVFVVLGAGGVLAGAVVATLPAGRPHRAGVPAGRPRLAVPLAARADALAVAPVFIAAWLLRGLYLSLGPSVAARRFGLRSHLVGGLLVTAFCGSGAVAGFLLRRPDRNVVRLAAILLAVGMSTTVAGVETGGRALAAVRTVVAGFGFGPSQLGSFGAVARVAAPEARSGLFAVLYVVVYVSFGPPTVIAGLAASSVPLADIVLAFGVAIVALSLLASSLPPGGDMASLRAAGRELRHWAIACTRRAHQRRQDPNHSLALPPLVTLCERCDPSCITPVSHLTPSSRTCH